MEKPEIKASFDPRDGDPHHISAYDYDAPFTWTEMALVVLFFVIAACVVYLAV